MAMEDEDLGVASIVEDINDEQRIYWKGWRDAIKAAEEAQPSTAENPNESQYHRGFFDGVMAYGRVLVGLKDA